MIVIYVIGALGAVVGLTVARSAAKTLWKSVLRTKVKGSQGERKVRRKLKGFSRSGGQIRNDILIPKEGKTTQIDHLMVTKHGIFVIETKNYSGTIEGTEFGNRWTQSFSDGRKSREFLNPILQNKSHIRALKQILPEYDNVPFYSIVAFTSKCRYPALPGVVSTKQLKTAIKMFSSGKPVLSKEQISEISQALDKKTISSRKARSAHNFRASLASSNVDPAQIQSLINSSAARATRLTFPQAKGPSQPPVDQNLKRQFTDICAKLEIRDQTDTIDGFFEKAKRRNDGSQVPPGGSFDYFICPFTGDKFPAELATDYYQGLWITYLNKNPDLVDYMREHGHENLGDSFRCKKVLALYNQNKDGLIFKVKSSPWYQNMVSRQKSKKPLNSQIENAASRKSPSDLSPQKKELDLKR